MFDFTQNQLHTKSLSNVWITPDVVMVLWGSGSVVAFLGATMAIPSPGFHPSSAESCADMAGWHTEIRPKLTTERKKVLPDLKATEKDLGEKIAMSKTDLLGCASVAEPAARVRHRAQSSELKIKRGAGCWRWPVVSSHFVVTSQSSHIGCKREK